jgi:hypothetical protein
MNAKVPTPIVDKNGKRTTVHKRTDDGKSGQGRAGSVAAPKQTVVEPERSEYVAPNRASLQKLIRYKGEVMTWGQLLEELQPVGIRRTLVGDEARPSWGAVHSDDESISTGITAQIAKDSGLEDITEPIDRVRDDLAVAQRKLDNATYGFNIRRTPDEIKYREQVNNLTAELLVFERDSAKDKLEGMDSSEKIGYMLNSIWAQSNSMAQVLAEDEDIEVVRALAASDARNYLDVDYRKNLINHPDEKVRENYMTGNNGLPVNKIFDVVEKDSSQLVRDAAQQQITSRGYEVYRDEGGMLHMNTLK